jgi:hypothetical protein
MKTPFHDKNGQLHWSYRALRSIAFIFPSPPPDTLGQEKIIEIPEEFRGYHQDKTGILLSTESEYWDKKNRWNPTSPKLIPGTKVYFDNTVPWDMHVYGLDMKRYRIFVCDESDILGIANA